MGQKIGSGHITTSMEFRNFVDQNQNQSKLWKAKRQDVIKFWQSLHPNLPIAVAAVPKHHTGTRFDSDGLRITGSAEFINSILSKLKEFLNYEQSDKTKLDVEYRQVQNKSGQINPKPIFACYIHVVEKM